MVFESDGVRVSAVDIVVNTVKRMLMEGELKVGDRLPNEMDLVKLCSVSRGSVREAMKILNAYGIIEIKRGEGTFVCSKCSRFMFNPLLFQILIKGYEMTALIEMRSIIERGILELVIQHASDQEIEELSQANDQFMAELAAHPQGSTQLARELDMRFHRMTGKYCHNPIMKEIYDFLLDFIAPSIDPGNPGVLQAHEGLGQALRQRNVELATQCLKAHQRSWTDEAKRWSGAAKENEPRRGDAAYRWKESLERRELKESQG